METQNEHCHCHSSLQKVRGADETDVLLRYPDNSPTEMLECWCIKTRGVEEPAEALLNK